MRFPDVFSRSHAVGITDSVGGLFMLSGLAVYQGVTATWCACWSFCLLYLLNPVMTHATLRAALRAGVKPWTKRRGGMTY